MTSSRVDGVSARIKVWNPLSRPVQISAEGDFIPGLSAGEIDLSLLDAARAFEQGHLLPEERVVAPKPEGQVEESAMVDIASEPMLAEVTAVEVEPETSDEDTKTAKPTRNKSQASKES